LIHLLLLAASLYGTGAAVVAFSNGTFGHHPAVAAVPAATALITTEAAPAILLPVVVVHAQAEVPTLATITVRPSRAERGALMSVGAGKPSPGAAISLGHAASTSLSSAAFDMPYYSFGKTLRHVSKE
jgi:hypothetical protein